MREDLGILRFLFNSLAFRVFIFSIPIFYFLVFLSSNLEQLQFSITAQLLRILGVSNVFNGSSLLLVYQRTNVIIPMGGITAKLIAFAIFTCFGFALNTITRVRVSILMLALLSFFIFLIMDLFIILAILPLGLSESYTMIDATCTTIVTAILIDVMLFTLMDLPEPVKIKQEIRFNRLTEYVILIGSLAGAIFISSLYLHYMFLLANFFSTGGFGVIHIYVEISFLGIFFSSFFILAYIANGVKPYYLKNWRDRLKKPPSITFLVAAYNEETRIAKCLEALNKAAAKYEGKVEVIVINDGSTDRTAEVARETMKRLYFIEGRVLDKENGGKGTALNFGLRYATGDVISTMDSDSYVTEDSLPHLMAHFSDPTVGVVTGVVYPSVERTPLQQIVGWRALLRIFYNRSMESLEAILCTPGSFSFLRREIPQKLGGWFQGQGDDADMTQRAVRMGYKVRFEDRMMGYSYAPTSFYGWYKTISKWRRGSFLAIARNASIMSVAHGAKGIFVYPFVLILRAMRLMLFFNIIHQIVVATFFLHPSTWQFASGAFLVFHVIMILASLEFIYIQIFLILKYKKYEKLKYLWGILPLMFMGLISYIQSVQTIAPRTSKKVSRTNWYRYPRDDWLEKFLMVR